MKHFGKIAVLGAVLAASAQFASAQITGSITVFGFDSISSAPGTISFTNPSTAVGGTGTLAAFNSESVTMVPSTGIINNLNTTGTDSLELFSIAGATTGTFTFNAAGATFASDTTSFVSFMGFGTLTETGYAPDTTAYLTFTSTAGGNTSFTLDASAPSATPEPSSLMLLGTGLVGAAGLMLRRSQQTATA
jgi:hypothetical protein